MADWLSRLPRCSCSAANVLHSAGVAALLSVVVVGGCASPGAPEPLPMRDVPSFSASGDAISPNRWWMAFEDDALNERVDRALAGNFTLAVAWERLQEAQAVARRDGATRWPTLDAVAGAERVMGDEIDNETRLSVGLEASYEVDLWGRVKSAVEAQEFRASATEADYHAAAISLSAEVALTWYELAANRLQVDLIQSQRRTNETVLEVLEQRFAIGQSGSADVLRQRQLVEATHEQLVIVRSRIDVLEHQLAVLEGRAPQSLDLLPPARLPEIPATPATGLPAELLKRRPDVRSALLRLHAADEDIAVAVSEQYPRIDLTASLVTTAQSASNLFTSWLATLAGQIAAPLLDGGQRRAEVERTEAARRQRLADFGQTVLVAFREVEDALAQEARQIERIQSLQRQLSLANSTSQQLRTQYLNGAADFIDVLTALREQQQIERSILTANLDRVSFRIALYRALAGDFVTPHETPEAKDHGGEMGDAAHG